MIPIFLCIASIFQSNFSADQAAGGVPGKNYRCPEARKVAPGFTMLRGADKSLARPTSRCILFDGENISFDAILVVCIYKQY